MLRRQQRTRLDQLVKDHVAHTASLPEATVTPTPVAGAPVSPQATVTLGLPPARELVALSKGKGKGKGPVGAGRAAKRRRRLEDDGFASMTESGEEPSVFAVADADWEEGDD